MEITDAILFLLSPYYFSFFLRSRQPIGSEHPGCTLIWSENVCNVPLFAAGLVYHDVMRIVQQNLMAVIAAFSLKFQDIIFPRSLITSV
jgi:hypothetical protein